MSRIVVVEDELIVARSIAKMLSLNGHEVPACVSSGEDAIAAAAALQPDLILMDIHLRGAMNGIEAARRIRETADLPIVFLTAYSDREHLEGAKASNPHGYLLKPYSDRELLTTIEVSLHRHRLERELREQARWLGTTLRSIGDGVVAVDPELRVTFVNAVAERLTGWSIADAAGRPVTEVMRLFDEDTGGSRELPLDRAVRDGVICKLDGRTLLQARDGTRLPIDDSVAAIVDDGGAILGGVVVFRDVSEHRILETQLALSDRMASLVTLTAGMGHELNNPLSSNLGNLELAASILPQVQAQVDALEAAATPARVASIRAALTDLGQLLGDARVGAERMGDLIGSLRELGRTERRVSRVDVVGLVETALRLTANELAQRAVVRREFRRHPVVEGHEGRLLQVMINLLTNAAQSIPDNSALGLVRVVVDETADHAVIEVIDSGTGIPAEVMVRIFEPFFTTRAVGAGTGLGLSIAHSIVAAHHGAIAVTSKPGAGTTFQVRLPRLGAEPVATPSPEVVADPVRRDVLLVEDDLGIRRVLQRVLGMNHAVRVAESGVEALARIEEREPDVILCDLMMPQMTGMQLHEILVTTRPALAARMLFHTGGAFTEATQAFVETHADRVLYKPVPPDELLAAIARVIR